MRIAQGICPVGGHPFTYEVKAGRKRVYCSDEHMWKAGAQRQSARVAALAIRICARCRQEKPATQFGGPTAPYCRPCANEYERERRKINGGQDPAYTRKVNLRRYGLTLETYEALLVAQNGKCAICGCDEPRGSGMWHVDHDHSCCSTRKTSCGRCIRGLLCSLCNVGIGNLRDDPALLRAALSYLETYAALRAAHPASPARS